VDNVYASAPARQPGLVVQLAFTLTLGILAGLCFLQGARAQADLAFLFWILLMLGFFSPVPWLVYSIYALWTASYTLERDGIRLRWGFRLETVPVDAVLWVRMSQDYPGHLPRPWFNLPGAVVGERQLPEGQVVEFMASRQRRLVLIATAGRIFAISPAKPDEFLEAFRQFSEMGSLAPLPARSVQPTSLFSELWADRRARGLLLGCIFLALVLLVWVAAIIPGRTQISLRFNPSGAPQEYIPAVQLLLIPLLNAFFCIADIFTGVFFFRRSEIRPLAYLLWGSSSLIALLFMGAILFITRFP
jgi:hypothetical protein